MTKIKLLDDRIIFDGHADTQRECETITLMCDNLAKSVDLFWTKANRDLGRQSQVHMISQT